MCAREAATNPVSTEVVQWDTSPGGSSWFELRISDSRWTGYTFRLTYEPRLGELVDLAIHREPGSSRLGAQDLQRVPLGALDRAARHHVNAFLTAWDRCRPADVRRLYPDAADWLEAVADARTAPDADVKLAQMCKRYIELDGQPGWRETLADEFGPYDPSTIPTKISRARARGFLGPVPPRQNGGQLTPKALRLLAPPKLQSAWEQATEEQRQAALLRDDLESRLSAELHRQWEEGQIDKRTFAARTHAITAYVYGWEPRELDLDPTLLADVERELQTMKEQNR